MGVLWHWTGEGPGPHNEAVGVERNKTDRNLTRTIQGSECAWPHICYPRMGWVGEESKSKLDS
eukprot:scaffold306261_cov38-Prasinocladus_malaysianus.AAC.1